MVAKRRPGRPPLPREQRRIIPLHVLITPEEYRRLKRAASADDSTMSAWVRRLIAAALRHDRG